LLCPHCGASTAAPTGMCVRCGKRLPQRAVTAATLTPPPEDEETRVGGPAPAPPESPATGPLSPGAPFGPRYKILSVLGAGGMGVVYHAWDEELGVGVALKVIRPEVMADASAAREVERRFKRELLLARQVTHRNVVRIHDLGEVEGIKYLTMPFVEGQTLAQVLRHPGRLPVPQALAIAREIAAGLAAAHEAGVVHRDLKPENIMVEGEHHAQIMDFGISRSFRPATTGVHDARGLERVSAVVLDPGALTGMTMAGVVIGSLPYMAPEQAKGQKVDHRADIYSFGLILRDMLVGRRRHEGQSAVDEMVRRIAEPPAGPRAIDPTIPEALDRIVRRCLDPDPAGRYQTTPELLADLDRLDAEGHPLPVAKRVTPRQAVAALVLVLASLAVTWRLARTPAVPAPHEAVSVLIADFENGTGDPVFQGSLEQALAIGIEGASFIGAYPRSDALKLQQQLAPGQPLDLERARLIAGREGIKVVLAGSIQPRGSGYRLGVRIVDPIPGKELSRVEVDAPSKGDVLQKVAEVAAKLRGRLGDTAPESARLAMGETFTSTSIEAARSYSEGQDLQWVAKYEESIPYYRKAIEADPKFGRAYANWAVSAFYLGRKEESEEMYKKAFALIDRMTEREKYRTYGSYYLTTARNYQMAIQYYTKLVELYPADRAGHGNLAVAYFYTLNFAKALEEGGKAMRLYPTSLKLRNNVALYAMYAGDFSAAEKTASEVAKADPTYYRAYLPIAVTAAARGDTSAARAAYRRMAEAGKQGRSLAISGEADLSLHEGRFADAIAALRDGIAFDDSIGNPAGKAAKQSALAEAYAGAGDKTAAAKAARAAASLSRSEAALLPAARVLLLAGGEAEARAIAERLGSDLNPQSRAYGKVIEGELALRQGHVPQAIDALIAAQKTADLWLTRFSLGVAYVAGEHHPEALAELETCQKRRGEATALFLDDVPTLRYLAPLPYWLGRAREGVGTRAAAVESYKAYLAARPATLDPLAADAQRRLAALAASP
jgi:serine/threonine protein kinase/tetratricopeptide (TPR) repeat protein